MATIVDSEVINLGTESENDRILRLVKMVETFIPTIDHCGLGVEFVGGLRIFMCSIYENSNSFCYCLYDRETHVEHKFKTKEEVAQKAKIYLDKHEVDDITISGFSLLKE
jgi:hypothetical protein